MRAADGSLTTARLVLRRWRDDDRRPFAAINADPEVTRYLSGPMSRAESDALVDRIIVHWERYGYGWLAVEERVSGSLLGFVGLAHHRALPDEVEIGWRLARQAWGRGLATEAATAVRDDAFDTLALPRLVSLTTDENLASRRVMDKLGFRFDRHVLFEQWRLRVHVADAPTTRPPGADAGGSR